jgi:hypothetical protein
MVAAALARFGSLNVLYNNAGINNGGPTEAERACDPNDCTLFGKGECKHSGVLNFWVPGVPGVGTIELHVTSIYASLGVAETLEMVKMGLGRVSGLLPNGNPYRVWTTTRTSTAMAGSATLPTSAIRLLLPVRTCALGIAMLWGTCAAMARLEKRLKTATFRLLAKALSNHR